MLVNTSLKIIGTPFSVALPTVQGTERSWNSNEIYFISTYLLCFTMFRHIWNYNWQGKQFLIKFFYIILILLTIKWYNIRLLWFFDITAPIILCGDFCCFDSDVIHQQNSYTNLERVIVIYFSNYCNYLFIHI